MSEAGGGHVDGGSRQRRRLRAIVGRVAGWQSSTFFSSQYQRILQVYTLLALPGPVSIKCLDQRVGHITRYRFWPHSKASKASKARGPRFADSKVMYSSLLEQRRLYRCSCRATLLNGKRATGPSLVLARLCWPTIEHPQAASANRRIMTTQSMHI